MRRAPLLLAALVGCADVTPIEDGATYGPVTVLQDWFTSVALVSTGAGPILVDAGFRDGALTKRLRREGVEPEEVRAVLLSHGHGDHFGGLSALPNARLWSHIDEAPLLIAEGEPPDERFGDASRLSFGDTVVETFHIGGHTPGTTVFLVDGVMLLGDACVVDGEGVVQPTPEKYSDDPRALNVALGDLARALDAEGVEVDWLVPSHSGAVRGLAPLLDFADRHGG